MGEIPSTDWSWVHSTAEQFEQAWKKGPRPRIEDYLPAVDEARRPSLLAELLRVECELRQRDGDPLSAGDYLGRFPCYGDVVAAVLDGGPVGATLCAEAGRSAPLADASLSDRGTAQPLPPELASHLDYHVVRELGRGGMGVVYLAHNRLMARDEVLKVMARHIVEQPGVLDRFLREIRAVARLRHPNIVSGHSAFRCGADLVFAMEYVVGLNLAQMVKAKGAVAVRQACAYVHQAALGLHYAHEEGMVHRDIKPANLMLSHQRGRAVIKLLDFGLSKAASEQNASDLGIGMAIDSYDLGEHLTCTGEMLGTPDFIAPEQIANAQEADIRADIYSLGCTLYYLLSGQAPFPNLPLREVLMAHRSLHARSLDQVRAEVPANLSAIVAKMMAKDPADRFQEPAEVAEALTAFFKKGSSVGGPSKPDGAHPGLWAATPGTLGPAAMPSSPATELAPGVAATAEKSSRAMSPGSTLGVLIDLSETDTGSEKRSESPLRKRRRPGPWGWSAIAGVLLLGLLTAWAAVPTTIQENAPPPVAGSQKQVSKSEVPGPKVPKLESPPAAPKDPIVSPPRPIARWTFESDARDEIGTAHGTLFGAAAIHAGRLYLDGKTGYMKTEPIGRDIGEKTLEAWVALSNLFQRGGGVISIEDGQYRYFDSIVFGEREPAKWMAGSDTHRRSKDLDSPAEHAPPSALIHVAIVYDREGGITFYREGKPHADRYVPPGDGRTVPTYSAGESHVLIGERHTQPADFLAGAVEEARLYDRALTPDEVAASYLAGVVRSTSDPGPVSAPPEPPDFPHPFRLATHGLGGREFIDPTSLRPDWAWFSEPGTALAWATNDDFARLTIKGAIAYPQLPESRYVLELELTVNAHGEVELQIGDMVNRFHQLRFAWNDERQKIECMLHARDYATMRASGNWLHDFAPGKRISLVMVVGDGTQAVFHDEALILLSHDWPQDCCLRILSYKPDSGVIHRCALRRLTPRDAAACGWGMPPTDLGLDARESSARLRRLFGKLPTRRRKEQPFAVRTTGTPMVWIKPGEFVMGPRDPTNEARHRVRLTKAFWMAQTEVTQGEFQIVTNGNPSRVRGSPHLPVDWVAWDQAMDFCRKLTEIERKAGRLPPGYEYRLPSEAEWEYACRAGSGEEFSVPKETVWSRDRRECRPHEVAESQPNLWGLYDMHGNVMEWCLDAWSDYPKGLKDVAVDPVRIGRPDRDTSFVVRGGAWWNEDRFCASDWRDRNPNAPNGFRGFRIVLGPEIQGLQIKE